MIPGSGKSLEEGHGNPLQFLPGESQGQRSLEGYSLWGRKEVDTTEATEHARTLCIQKGSLTPQRAAFLSRNPLKWFIPGFFSQHCHLYIFLHPHLPSLNFADSHLPIPMARNPPYTEYCSLGHFLQILPIHPLSQIKNPTVTRLHFFRW